MRSKSAKSKSATSTRRTYKAQRNHRIIEEQGKLTPKLKADIERADKMQRVEDLYRPYKQKRRTKAAIAREKGLAPFAEWLMNGPTSGSLSVEAKAKEFLNEEMELSTIEDVFGWSP